MTVVSIVLSACVVLITVAAAWWWMALPTPREVVVLNFRQPHTPPMEGVLITRRGRWLVLRNCRLLEREPAPIDGEVTVDQASILFIQRPRV